MPFLQALAAKIEKTPGEPLLFYRRDLDWGWLPYRWIPEVIAELHPLIAPVREGARVVFADTPSLPSFALDMTLLDGGWVSLPLSARELRKRSGGAAAIATAHLYFAGRIPKIAVDLEVLAPEDTKGPQAVTGGIVVSDGPAGMRERPLSWLEASAGALVELLGAPVESGLAPARDILISWRPWSKASERALLAWALTSGAAIIFEPQRPATAATAGWMGPTVLQGSGSELSDLADRLSNARGSMTRRRLRRLRAVLVDGGTLGDSAHAFYTMLGARTVDLTLAIPEPPPPVL